LLSQLFSGPIIPDQPECLNLKKTRKYVRRMKIFGINKVPKKSRQYPEINPDVRPVMAGQGFTAAFG
jgi:hypothetical protein